VFLKVKKLGIVICIFIETLQIGFDFYESIANNVSNAHIAPTSIGLPIRVFILLFMFERAMSLKIHKAINIDGEYKSVPRRRTRSGISDKPIEIVKEERRTSDEFKHLHDVE